MSITNLISDRRAPILKYEWDALDFKFWKRIEESKQLLQDEHLLYVLYRGISHVTRFLKLAEDRKESIDLLLNMPLKSFTIFGEEYSNGRNTALHYAIMSKSEDSAAMVRMLCKAGAKPSDALITLWMLICVKDSDKSETSVSSVYENIHALFGVLKDSAETKISDDQKQKMEWIDWMMSGGVKLAKYAENTGWLPTSSKAKRKRATLESGGMYEFFESIFS